MPFCFLSIYFSDQIIPPPPSPLLYPSDCLSQRTVMGNILPDDFAIRCFLLIALAFMAFSLITFALIAFSPFIIRTQYCAVRQPAVFFFVVFIPAIFFQYLFKIIVLPERLFMKP